MENAGTSGAQLVEYANDISIALATAAHAGTSHVPERRALQVRSEYAAHLAQVRQKLEAYITNDETRAQVLAQFERYRQGYRKHYSAWLSAKSRIMSTMIAGPSNFPVRRMEKANRSEDNRRNDLTRWHDRAMKAIIRILTPATDPLEELRAQLAKRERYQLQAKTINAAIRKGKKLDVEKRVEMLVTELKLSEATARKLLEPDFCGRIGIPDYSLRNNLANIKRIQGRITELEAKERVRETMRAERSEMPDGGRMVENVELDRLQLIFPGKPSDAIRTLLKSNGFRWAPSEGAWQRQLTQNARYAAQHVIARIEEATP